MNCKFFSVIYPDVFTQPLKLWIKSGLRDLSVSREKSKNPWGIPVPDDPSQTVMHFSQELIIISFASA